MLQPIGTITGFTLSVSRSTESATICALSGKVHAPNWPSISYCAHSATVSVDKKGGRYRVYILDEEMYARPFSDTGHGFLRIDSDEVTQRGLYPGGLIVLGYVDIHSATATGEGEKPLTQRERTSLLAIIRALSVMAKLPDRGATGAVEKQLQELGFDTPKEATIRAALKEAGETQP